jgi:hypothetical protein
MFRLSKQKRFGKSSEQMDGQPGLFDEVELEADIKVPEPQIEEVETPEAHKRGKREVLMQKICCSDFYN